MVLLGKVISRKEFDPTYAFLVQNQDELQIPLELPGGDRHQWGIISA